MARQNWVQALSEGLSGLRQGLAYRQRRKEQTAEEERALQRHTAYMEEAERRKQLSPVEEQRAAERHQAFLDERRAGGKSMVDQFARTFAAIGLDDSGRNAATSAWLAAGKDPTKAVSVLEAQLRQIQDPPPPAADPLDVQQSQAALKAHEAARKETMGQRGSLQGAINALRLLGEGQILPQSADQALTQAQAQTAPAPSPVSAQLDEEWLALMRLLQAPGAITNMGQLRAARQLAPTKAGVPIQGGAAIQ